VAGTDRVQVNSLHSQAVARLARGVTVEAVADDGLVEAFRVDSAESFALAVQWHPEWRVTENEFSMSIFRAFGDACRVRAAKRNQSQPQVERE
jgi:putative glutamine amidotransferase